MSGHMIGLIAGIIIGIITAIISLIFVEKKVNKAHGHSSAKSSDSGSEFLETKRELERLQAQIDEINRKKAIKGCSSIDSSYDYKTACEELDITDFDLLQEWDRRSESKFEQVTRLQEQLKALDKKLDSKREVETILKQLDDLFLDYPDNVEILYRIGRAHAILSEEESQEIAKNHIEQGIQALSAALKLNEKHAEVHKWYAILLGLRCQFQSLTQKAKDGLLMKKHCEIACALKPKDPVLHYLMGRFDYEIAGLGWFEKTLAKPLLGDLNSTYKDALERFMTAERLSKTNQNFSVGEKKENKTMIGRSFIALEKKEEAMYWLMQAKRLGPVGSPLDLEVEKLIRQCR